MTDTLKPILARLADGHGLDFATAQQAFTLLLSGAATDAQAAAFLMALRVRGETIDELVAGAQIMRANAVRVNAPENAIDTCGTGGDGSGTYNISTAVAFVVAACGVPVAKHGNKALSSKSGSSEVLEKLGVKLDLSPAQISHCISTVGMGFMFAPAHHSAMRHVGAIRAELGVRTIFNLIGPLANPADAKNQLLGVYDAKWLAPLAHTLHKLGSRSAWVVHGSDGLDELTITGVSHVAQLKNGAVTCFDVSPADAGLAQAKASDLIGGAPEKNAAALKSVLQGAKGAYRDIVVLNAAAALKVAEVAEVADDDSSSERGDSNPQDLKKYAAQAIHALDSGQAYAVLTALIKASHK